MAYTLTITGSSGTYTTQNFQHNGTSEEFAREVRRAPYTDQWFSVGDGRSNPHVLELRITVVGSSQDAAITAVTSLRNAARTATTVDIGVYRYTVDGIAAFNKTPRAGTGYTVDVAFALTAATATNTSTSAVVVV